MDNLKNLVDTSYSGYKKLDHQHIFDTIANNLLNSYVLHVGNNKYRLCEIEFYYKDDKYQDPFLHGYSDQAKFCCWYFHRQNGMNYKGGTFKGLDLTLCGTDKKNSCGGILIRSIYDLDKKILIEGPCKIVDTFLKVAKQKSVSDLVDKLRVANKQKFGPAYAYMCGNEKDGSYMYLEYDSKNILNKEKVFTGPRVGLTLKVSNKKKQKFIMKNCRYLVYPNLIKKFNSGIVINMYYTGLTKQKICEMTNIKLHIVNKYCDIYDGCDIDSENIDNFSGKNLSTVDLIKLQKICLNG